MFLRHSLEVAVFLILVAAAARASPSKRLTSCSEPCVRQSSLIQLCHATHRNDAATDLVGCVCNQSAAATEQFMADCLGCEDATHQQYAQALTWGAVCEVYRDKGASAAAECSKAGSSHPCVSTTSWYRRSRHGSHRSTNQGGCGIIKSIAGDCSTTTTASSTATVNSTSTTGSATSAASINTSPAATVQSTLSVATLLASLALVALAAMIS